MRALLRSLRLPLGLAAVISTGVNLLMLVSPIFMMQVFDRVLMSGHLETLYGLTLIALVAICVLGMFEALRQQVLARAGDWLERNAGDRIIDAALNRALPGQQAFQHVGAVKRFFCAQGVFSLLDAPWVLVFAAVLWWMHPWLGIAAAGGAVALAVIALMTELASRRPLTDAAKHQGETQAILSGALRNADAVRAMGMAPVLKSRWRDASAAALDLQGRAAGRAAVLSGMAKAIRLGVQVGILAIGAFLVLQTELTPGGMIAASILLGRCLAPVEQAIGAWKGFVLARDAWKTLNELKEDGMGEVPMDLPEPEGKIVLDKATFAPLEDRPPVLDGIDLTLDPGQVLCLVGPSGSGKTTLCRMLVGALKPTSGDATLDGRAMTGWNPTQLGRFVGYLPQGVELLPGTIKDNIQRFGADDPEGVMQAARAADVDGLIRSLPDGYETAIRGGSSPLLSAGQLQRIALARALYGAPRLIVLDEPNANLDTAGGMALSAAIKQAADGGAAVIVVTHRPALLQIVDRIAILQAGKLVNDGPKSDLLAPQPVPKSVRPAAAAGELYASAPSGSGGLRASGQRGSEGVGGQGVVGQGGNGQKESVPGASRAADSRGGDPRAARRPRAV